MRVCVWVCVWVYLRMRFRFVRLLGQSNCKLLIIRTTHSTLFHSPLSISTRAAYGMPQLSLLSSNKQASTTFTSTCMLGITRQPKFGWTWTGRDSSQLSSFLCGPLQLQLATTAPLCHWQQAMQWLLSWLIHLMWDCINISTVMPQHSMACFYLLTYEKWLSSSVNFNCV